MFHLTHFKYDNKLSSHGLSQIYTVAKSQKIYGRG